MKILNSKEELNKRIDNLKPYFSEGEEQGHKEKAEHNLEFASETKQKFSDWKVVGCYFTLYHMALALLAKKGYTSKSHDATLCLLIREYRKVLTEEEIKQLNETFIDNTDILFYAHTKEKRKTASYSNERDFDTKKILFKTRVLFNKMLI